MRKLGVTAMLLALVSATACGNGGTTAGNAAPATDTARSSASAGETTSAESTQPSSTRGPTTSASPEDAAPTGPAASCADVSTWNQRPDEMAGSSRDKLFRVRTGQHECFDRVVFDIDGTDEPGGLVHYVPVVRAGGSGTPYPVAGGATLEVIVRASITGYPSGTPTLGEPGTRLYSAAELDGWRSLREVRFAGFFEGQSAIALGVREDMPFRAFTLVDAENGISKLVVDIAHQRT